MTINTLLFDFDGTLQFGDKEELVQRLNKIVESLFMNIDKDEISSIADSTSDYKEMKKKMIDLHNFRSSSLINEGSFDEINKKISGTLDHLFYLEDGARSTLDYFKENGYKLGLVTTRGGNSLPRLLNETHKIARFFNVTICRDDCKERKPNPTPILMALERLNSEPSGSLYVGDNQIEDIGAAKNAKIISVLKSYSNTLYFDGVPIPDYKIKRIIELPLLLIKINNV